MALDRLKLWFIFFFAQSCVHKHCLAAIGFFICMEWGCAAGLSEYKVQGGYAKARMSGNEN
jgi:hypothetical protein